MNPVRLVCRNARKDYDTWRGDIDLNFPNFNWLVYLGVLNYIKISVAL